MAAPFPTPDRLFIRDDLVSAPNCGVTAVAVIARVPIAEAHEVIRKIKGVSRRWRGGTSHADRIDALHHYGVPHTVYRLKDRRRLATWVRDRAEPGKTYMLRITGHVLVLRDGWCMDQKGARHISVYPFGKSLLTHVVEVL